MAFKLTLRVTFAPGAPDPPDKESDGVCATASCPNAKTQMARAALQYRALMARLPHFICVAEMALPYFRLTQLVETRLPMVTYVSLTFADIGLVTSAFRISLFEAQNHLTSPPPLGRGGLHVRDITAAAI